MLLSFWTSSLWLTLLCFVLIAGYVPLNRLLHTGHHWKSRWDDRLPLMPWFVFPYLFLYMPWMFGLYAFLYFRPLADIQQVFLTTLAAVTIGYVCFFFWPTYVITEYPKGKGLALALLQWLHLTDKPFNACPSMHVFMTTLLMLFSWQWWPAYWWLWVSLALVITISTVLTKRHYLYDVLGGVLVGFFSYFLVLGVR